MNFEPLLEAARKVLSPRRLTDYVEAGQVAAALMTDRGNIYTGVCIDAACSVGFWAEHAAAAAMITAGESKVVQMVAVDRDGTALPPCGRCREFISQLHDDNLHAAVLLPGGHTMRLLELMPFDWKESRRIRMAEKK